MNDAEWIAAVQEEICKIILEEAAKPPTNAELIAALKTLAKAGGK